MFYSNLIKIEKWIYTISISTKENSILLRLFWNMTGVLGQDNSEISSFFETDVESIEDFLPAISFE